MVLPLTSPLSYSSIQMSNLPLKNLTVLVCLLERSVQERPARDFYRLKSEAAFGRPRFSIFICCPGLVCLGTSIFYSTIQNLQEDSKRDHRANPAGYLLSPTKVVGS